MSGHLHNGDDDNDNDDEEDYIGPPEPDAMPHATASPGLVRNILRLGDGRLVEIRHCGDVRFFFEVEC